MSFKSDQKSNKYIDGAGLFVISSILSFAIMIVTLPIYTRLLSPEEYGITIVFLIFGKLVTGFFHFSLHDSTYRFYFEYSKINLFKQLNSSNFLFIIISFLLCYLACSLASSLFYEKIFDGKLDPYLIKLSLISGFLDYFLLYLMTLLTAQLRAKEHALFSILLITLNTAFSIFFMSYYSLSYMGRIYGIITAQLITLVLLLRSCSNTFSFLISVKMLKKSFKYAIPYYPIMLLGLSSNYLDKTMISSSRGNAALGQYSVGVSFANILKTIMDSVSKSWNAFMIAEALKNTEESKKNIVDKFYYMAVFFMILGLGITYFSEEAIKILTTPEYHKAIWITPIYIYFYLFAIMGYLTNMQLSVAKKMKFLIPGTIASGTTNVILNITLIPIYGMMGAAIAAAGTSLISQLFLFYYGMKVFPLDINKKKLLKLFIILMFFTLPAYILYAQDIHFVLKIMVKLIGVYLFIKICIFLKFIDKHYVLSILDDYKYLNKMKPALNKIF